METVIELKHVTKSFEDSILFEDFSCKIFAGEMVAITGASGSGKTTLLNIIGLIEKYDQGEVRYYDEVIDAKDRKKQKELLRDTIGFMFQNFALIDEDTVQSNIEIGLHKTFDNKNKIVQAALAEVNLYDVAEKYVYTLSGGEQQRVALARVFVKDCSVILADEPTGSLDKQNRDHILQLLQVCRDNGKTIILVTHDEEVANVCDRIIAL